ncbi:MAG: amidohydrolase family protein [Nanoarchaeota archaeon]|nr:amidohydrolase family protein [Nanoarchaeota archaeon]
MRVIDVHLHLDIEDRNRKSVLFLNKPEYTKEKLLAEMKEAGVERGVFNTADSVGDGIESPAYPTPIRMYDALEYVKDTSSLRLMPGINPNSIPKNALRLTEEALKNGQIAGFKVLSGYTHFYPQDPIYHKFYNLAVKYDVPVMFHTGDLYDPEGITLAKYAHPLHLDEVAVKFRKMKIIIAHLGNPWVRDAAFVLSKNPNVYADLSGFFVDRVPKSAPAIASELQFAMEYVGEPHKFLYGTDWPLVRMKDYFGFMKKIVPSSFRKNVFYSNAKEMFNF